MPPPSLEGADTPEALESEESPLLGNGNDIDNGTIERDTEGGLDKDIPIAEEPTTANLLLVLGSIWLGCFLAALDSTV